MNVKSTLIMGVCFLIWSCSNHSGPLESENDTLEFKVDSVLALMTLEEKVGQLNQYNGSWDMTGPPPKDMNAQQVYENIKNGLVGSILNTVTAKGTYEAQKLVMENSRLKIPLIFGHDVIHGYKTIFPVPLGEAASWDMESITYATSIAAKEAAAAGIHWTFAPMVDIARDARWGRIMEGGGEDTYLGSQIAAARVRGFQGEDLGDPTTVAACAKHFAAYGFAVDGRDYNTVDIGTATLHNVVLPPFKAAVDAGVATFMNSFNEINGTPATGDAYLQRDILKGDWGFDGFVVSDWNSIGEMISHGFVPDSASAALAAIKAGSDMDMQCEIYLKFLPKLVEQGLIGEDLLDDAVRRILRIKFRLGLFDDPYRYSNEAREKETLYAKAHQEAAREAARKSMVLLKNSTSLLPLSKSTKSIGLIGPFAADKDNILGNWRSQGEPNSAVSVMEGIQNVAPNVKIRYAQGCRLINGARRFAYKLYINEIDRSGFDEALRIARESEVVIMVLGEDCFLSGEARSRANLDLPGLQQELLEEVYKVNQNIVLLLMNGRPLSVKWAADHVPSILETWFAGSQGGNAIADILFGDYNPSGKLPVTFPQFVGQEPMYYNQKSTGRPATDEPDFVGFTRFEDISNEPLYPFGFGLSYTSFDYGDLVLSKSEINQEEELLVSVEITNSGSRVGKETVQLYIRDHFASITRPVKELKDFQQLEIAPGQSKTVTFSLPMSKLAFYNQNGDSVLEPGTFSVMVGSHSNNLIEKTFVLK